jgi:hypothetical protein
MAGHSKKMLVLQFICHEKDEIFLSFLFDVKIGLPDVRQYVMGTHFHADRVSFTLITAEGLVGISIHETGAEWTGEYTPFASDTQIRVHDHGAGFRISLGGASRTGLFTRGMGTVVAQRRCIMYFAIIDMSNASNARNEAVAFFGVR